MKNILPYLVIGILVLSGLGASAAVVDQESIMIETTNETIIASSERGTHTVLGEYGTATWCGYCKYAHGALKALYAEGQLDFYYVSFVSDKNSVAATYLSSTYNLYGYPTLWFDGGYKTNVGAGSIPSAKSTYTSSINQCLARPVEDVDIDLSMTWLGSTEMQIDCIVTNNEADIYGGTVRVYICEKESSMGWKDTAGVTYTMPFLDFAFYSQLSIPAGGTWSDTMVWNGAAHGYGSITEENMIIIAAVYNDEWHQGYSYPPSTNPFDAYYVDECVAVYVNAPPEVPTIDGPATGQTGVEYNYTFVTTDHESDLVYYWIDWGDSCPAVEWIGPYTSGEIVTVAHTYDTQGDFIISAKAKDSSDAESDWGTLEVTMPLSQGTTDSIFGWTIIRGFIGNLKKQGNDLYFRAIRLHY
ncbi:MAG: hypothetical protein KKC68_02930, partial [Candidatus Thermoplasmatota archaeon]|nr:hypothetical protein [Candidatus Thermoplasmatota archaeon]